MAPAKVDLIICAMESMGNTLWITCIQTGSRSIGKFMGENIRVPNTHGIQIAKVVSSFRHRKIHS